MSPAALPLLLGAVLAAADPVVLASADPLIVASAGNTPSPDASLFTQSLPSTMDDLVPQALPPAPDKVVRKTKSYGTVTIDHRAHLARRAACKSCHGPEAVTKIVFTPRLAHDRCRGCHQEQKRGPLDCRGCHVIGAEGIPGLTAPPQQPVQAAAKPSPGAVTTGGPGTATVAALSPRPAAPLPPLAPDPELEAVLIPRSSRTVHVGAVAGFSGSGLEVQLASRDGALLIAHSVLWMSNASEARTVGLLGMGLTRTLNPSWSMEALGVGGFSALERPSTTIAPTGGARLGVVWVPRRSAFTGVNVAFTGLVAPSSSGSSGRSTGSVAFFTVGTGLWVSR